MTPQAKQSKYTRRNLETMNKVLHITLKKQWFDMIASGEKKEEYREIESYWLSRLIKAKTPLNLHQFGVHYTDVRSMFWFSVGFKGNKPSAFEFLLNEDCIELKQFDIVSANNGYQKNCPNIQWRHEGIRIGEGKPEWGAEPGRQYFILQIGELIP